MNAKKFSEAMGELDSRYIEEAVCFKKKSKKTVWVKWGTITAACLVMVCAAAIHFTAGNENGVSNNADNTADSGNEVSDNLDTARGNGNKASENTDVAPMVYVNGELYICTDEKVVRKDLTDRLIYLGEIKSDIIQLQGGSGTGSLMDGVPKENFQANVPIVGAKVYQYEDGNIIIEVDDEYWIYKLVDYGGVENEDGLSIEEKMQIAPSYKSFIPL